MTDWIDFASSSQDDKAAALGDEFRCIHVIRASFGGTCMVEVVINGCVQMLVGDPKQVLKTYLGGGDPNEVHQ